SVYDIPLAFKGTGFLIARLTFRLIAGSQWTYITQEDLRGQHPGLSAGVGVTTTDHALLANLTFATAGHTGFQAQGDVLDDLNSVGQVGADSEFLVGTGAGTFAWEDASTAATSMGLGTGDSPTFAGLTLSGDLIIRNEGYIGSVSDVDAIQIEADGDVVLTQDLTLNTGNLLINGGVLYTDDIQEDDSNQGVTIDSVLLKDGGIVISDGGTIGSVSDPNVMTIDASGNTTFSVFPITPSAAPDADYEVANKKYVDDGGGAHTHDGDTLQLDGINSNGGAFGFNTTGVVTFNQGINVTNTITEFSTDVTLGGDSDSAVPTEKAVKTYTDARGYFQRDWADNNDDWNLAAHDGASKADETWIDLDFG
ncbi:hypothetical protein LCGC14_2999950, partial [marine sediment metagenome]